MYIDYKIQIWRRMCLPKETRKEDVINHIDKNYECINIPFEDFNILSDEILFDTEEHLGRENNNNQPTIEVMDDNGNTIWDNINGETK